MTGRSTRQHICALLAILVLLGLSTGCVTPLPRTDDPYESFNRKMSSFNDSADRTVARPLAVGYRKITSQRARAMISNFFDNLESPVTIGNEFLQAQLSDGWTAVCRFAINSTVGIFGFFDPATHFGFNHVDTDFGVTLARWGFGDGPYLVLPFFGSTSSRDAWSIPVDSFLLNPLYYYSSSHQMLLDAQYAPTGIYLVTLRASVIDAEPLLDGAFDRYAFVRDAYRQRRTYKIYRGNPPADVVGVLQGEQQPDIEEMINEQQRYESKQQ